MRHVLTTVACTVVAGSLLVARATPPLPNEPGSLKMVVMGDNGDGSREQAEVAGQMAKLRQQFRYDLVLMVGDNFYGSQRPSDLEQKFTRPYRPLLDAGVIFQAALGNHDVESTTINYPPLNMDGRRYYSFVRPGVRFVVLDTNVLDAEQLHWADEVLRGATEPWRIAYFHHPLYGNAKRHGSNVDLRVLLEPLLLARGVQVVFSGHDHVYERLKPQKGISYFVTGSAGKLRKGGLEFTDSTAAGFDQDQVFLAAEITSDALHFQAISRSGQTVDSGVIRRLPARVGS
jgi:3',5'-cyclic AMP phosphodiesterase CpdA